LKSNNISRNPEKGEKFFRKRRKLDKVRKETGSSSQKLVRGNESLGDTIDFLRNKEDAVKAPMPTRSHAKCRRKSRYCGEFHTSALIMIGIVMSILSASNTSPSHDVLPLECGGNLTCKWDYV